MARGGVVKTVTLVELELNWMSVALGWVKRKKIKKIKLALKALSRQNAIKPLGAQGNGHRL